MRDNGRVFDCFVARSVLISSIHRNFQKIRENNEGTALHYYLTLAWPISTFECEFLLKLVHLLLFYLPKHGSHFWIKFSNSRLVALIFFDHLSLAMASAIFDPRNYIHEFLKTSAEILCIEMVNDDEEDNVTNMEESYSPKPRSNSIAEPTSTSPSAFSHKRNRSETIAALGRFTITQRNSSDILMVTPEAGQEVHTSAPPASREYPKSDRFIVDPAKSKVRFANP